MRPETIFRMKWRSDEQNTSVISFGYVSRHCRFAVITLRVRKDKGNILANLHSKREDCFFPSIVESHPADPGIALYTKPGAHFKFI